MNSGSDDIAGAHLIRLGKSSTLDLPYESRESRGCGLNVDPD